ncbi:hypothetical protein GCM10023204_50770 [Actinomycetospora succinea]
MLTEGSLVIGDASGRRGSTAVSGRGNGRLAAGNEGAELLNPAPVAYPLPPARNRRGRAAVRHHELDDERPGAEPIGVM